MNKRGADVLCFVGLLLTVLGVVTIISYFTHMFRRFSGTFFLLSAAFSLYHVYLDVSTTAVKIAPKKLSFNPHVLNAINFGIFGVLQGRSILYILDTMYLHFTVFAQFITFDDKTRRKLLKFCETDALRNLMALWEVFAVLDLVLSVLFWDQSPGSLICLVSYIVCVSMFGYKVSYRHQNIWKDAYRIIENHYGRAKGVPKRILYYVVRFGDLMSIVATRLYPTSPLKIVMQ